MNMPDMITRDRTEACALDLQTGRCMLEATSHCREICPYQAMLREGTAPVSAETSLMEGES